MKRDMDLVRFILIQVEHADGRIDAENLGNEDTALDVVFYHLELMQAHGLLDASLQYGYDGSKNVAY